MRNRLIVAVLALVAAFAYSKVTQRTRLKEALAAHSQFEPINEARAAGKPLLMSVLLPGCPWAARANAQLVEMKGHFGDRYVFFQLQGAAVTTSGRDPFDYLASKCTGGLCLFDPTSGRVEQLDEMMPEADLKARMEAFSGPR